MGVAAACRRIDSPRRAMTGARSQRTILAAGLLALLAVLPYLQTLRFEFVNWDDPSNVVQNAHLQAGLSWSGVIWAFTTFQCGYWHPLTWLSHMLDIQIWAMHAGGHHFTNVLFHVANTALLSAILLRATGTIWRSALVAALFAIHPLHAESVAWISDRTDLLSTFFALLALWTYVGYSRQRSFSRYLLVTALFILGLMTKSTVIVLPFIFILMDVWPLGRLGDQRSATRAHRAILGGLVLEKLPWLFLSVAFAIFGALSQRTIWSTSGYTTFPFPARIENAVVAYTRYIGKLFAPVNLAFFYPHPIHWPILQVVLSGIFLGAVTAVAMMYRRSRPWLLIGWLWFVGSLVPVIGLVHVGWQSIADRYMYFSSIGIFIALVWSIPRSGLERFPRGIAVLAGIVIVLLTAMTAVQASYWRNSHALFAHAVQVTTGNFLAEQDLGNVLEKEGDLNGSLELYRQAAAERPAYAKIKVHENIANVLIQKGRYAEAMAELKRAVRVNPASSEAYNSMGSIELMAHDYQDAAEYFERAVTLEPGNTAAHINYGTALVNLRRWNEAIDQLAPITRNDPKRIVARTNLALALAGRGDIDAAVNELRQVQKIAPDYEPARQALSEIQNKKP